ncbi:ABC transporter substrate-binding protein [Caloranaerobacter ferrireducens]|uniref:ABC transporter substrate-binding protein n=1 Tax=Caloranaerobacter ferrireducens TaxID=1323370 RepID=UPI00084E07A6|nr:ABC transporter substrate-binding protein [Caloranaerobacter ferrireducens]
MKKSLSLILIIVMMSLLVIGCGTNSEKVTNTEANVSTNSLKGTTIKVFAAYGGKDQIFSEFEKDTGIKVEYLGMSSGEVLARIRAEKGKPLADVWFGGGVDSFIAAKNDGLLEKYVSKEAEKIPVQFKDKDGYWTGVSLVTVNFIVNEQISKEKGIEIPQKWTDLLKPEFKDEVLMSNPSISGTAYTILSGILQTMGKEEGWAFLEELNKNIPYYAKRGSEPPKKAALGEVIVGLAPDTGEKLKAEGYPIVSVFPKDGTPWWPSPVAILKGAENLEGAKAFVDWCLSEKGQRVLRDNCPRVPTREGIELPEVLKGIKDAKLMNIDFEVAGKERDSIVEEWKQRFGN